MENEKNYARLVVSNDKIDISLKNEFSIISAVKNKLNSHFSFLKKNNQTNRSDIKLYFMI